MALEDETAAEPTARGEQQEKRQKEEVDEGWEDRGVHTPGEETGCLCPSPVNGEREREAVQVDSVSTSEKDDEGR